MRVFHLRPDPDLRPFIDRFWGWQYPEYPEHPAPGADREPAPVRPRPQHRSQPHGQDLALPLLLPGAGAEVYFHRDTPFSAAAFDPTEGPPPSLAPGAATRAGAVEYPCPPPLPSTPPGMHAPALAVGHPGAEMGANTGLNTGLNTGAVSASVMPPAQTLPGAHLFALRRRTVQLLPAPRVDFIAVRFRAGMVHRFTAIPGAELADAFLTPGDLWGPAGAHLAVRLAETPSLPARAALLQAFLRARLRADALDALAETAVARLYRQSPAGAGDGHGAHDDGNAAAGIARLAADLDLGRRQLERRVGALTGLAPVAWKRLVRLQKTARRLALAPDASLTDTALALGYYDQAHCIRDFRALAGLTPGQYRTLLASGTHFYNPPGSSAGILAAPSPTSR
ncbi:hypothetical protein OTERR_11750 [Oryzomicrobium terrae]|uniref:HTH araC/xylS-type domain-containing protein n=1 Tax=Oryzomicrobium terrae TaxID=1735038 RepID=A0A5C1E6V3_9RHOO|nr:helix-turn-helix domain-containing protein [Oryzomicrobium terrae]QEL64651.1 hypothetical protein OTERR_11750 [Oryzomicrobium terrae]